MDEAPINFCFPIRTLEDEHVKLCPFHKWKHAPKFIEGLGSSLEAFAQFSSGPYKSVTDFITTFLSERSYPDESMFTYAVITKVSADSEEAGAENPDGGDIAGMVSLSKANTQNLSAEVGLLQILPALRSQGLATRAGRLLLEYCMNPSEEGGIGLVRLEWHSTTTNRASIKVARRLGFKELGTIEYEKKLPNGVARGKVGNGKPSPPGTAPGDLWRDVVIFGMLWDDWEKRGTE